MWCVIELLPSPIKTLIEVTHEFKQIPQISKLFQNSVFALLNRNTEIDPVRNICALISMLEKAVAQADDVCS